MYRGIEIPSEGVFNFAGGLASAKPSSRLDVNQGFDLHNIIITPSGGIKKRQGNSAFCSAMESGDEVAGLGYFKLAAGTEYLVAVCNDKIYKSDSFDGTMDDITGTATIVSSPNNIYDFITFEDVLIGVGGSPSVPWKWTGSGTAAALGGSPPSGTFGFLHNDRIFIGLNSTLYWSVLADAEDWSGTGSGNATVWTSDNDTLVGYAIISMDTVLLFKQNSIHMKRGSTSPFPIFPLFRGVGAVGKHAIVEVDGLVYFITPKGRMKITDGSRIYDSETFPRLHDIDDVWDGLNASRLQYIQGVRYEGKDFDHLVWSCCSGTATENNLAIVWDLRHKCWLKHTTGWNGNVYCKRQNGNLYMGGYDGIIYQQDYASKYYDDSETSPGAIDGFWRWGWHTMSSLQTSSKPFRLNTIVKSFTSGNLIISYGFDFSSDDRSELVSMQGEGGLWGVMLWGVGKWGGPTDMIRSIFLKGRGTAFQHAYRNKTNGQSFEIHGFTISGKKSAQKVMAAQ
jgi:hypothetical protein